MEFNLQQTQNHWKKIIKKKRIYNLPSIDTNMLSFFDKIPTFN